MELRAKIALTLPNTFFKITLTYDTFEKATFDSYLIASVISSAKTKISAMDYIDDITGKGSLNPHFKKLYDKISKLSKEQIEGILVDSLYPVTVIDKKHFFRFYEMLDASKMDNQVFIGNLKENPRLMDLLMPNDKEAKFRSLAFECEDGILRSDNYNAIFSDKTILIDLGSGTYLPISKENFEKAYKSDIQDISVYPGKIGTTISDGNWFVLNNVVLRAFGQNKQSFIDETGNVCLITSDYVKKTEIIKVFSLYFYNETSYQYETKNAEMCEQVISILMKTNSINEFRTKSLINILAVVSDKTAQNVINYILSRKDSKEIGEVGMKLIKNGLEKGWDEEALKAIKKTTPQSEIKHLYKINNKLGFDMSDLLTIDDIDLSESDRVKKQVYLVERKNKQNEINLMIGEITTSGIREKMKKLPTKDQVQKSLNSFINDEIAHLQKGINDLSNEDLNKRYEYIKSVYLGSYQKIKERCEKME